MNIELHQIEQLAVVHFGKQKFRAALQHIPDELLFRFDQSVYAVLNSATADELVHQHVAPLADAEGAIGGLILHGGIPPAVEVDDVRGGGKVESRAAGLERE